jgi:hypothetical protein
MNAAFQAQLAQLAQIHQLVLQNSSSLDQIQQQLQQIVTGGPLNHSERARALFADEGAADNIF